MRTENGLESRGPSCANLEHHARLSLCQSGTQVAATRLYLICVHAPLHFRRRRPLERHNLPQHLLLTSLVRAPQRLFEFGSVVLSPHIAQCASCQSEVYRTLQAVVDSMSSGYYQDPDVFFALVDSICNPAGKGDFLSSRLHYGTRGRDPRLHSPLAFEIGACAFLPVLQDQSAR